MPNVDGHRPHVFIVNDTQEILDLMQELLEWEDYRVTTSTALLDIDAVKAIDPDVIIQDLQVERVQQAGWTFLALARVDPELAAIPLILCTAAVGAVKEPATAAMLDELGVRVAPKPFAIDHLLEMLENAVAEREAVAACGAAR